jgi:hypothetical protein
VSALDRTRRPVAVALVLACAHGLAAAAIAPKAAQDLARRSGLSAQLDSIGAQVRAGMASAMGGGAGAQADPHQARLLDCAQSAYAPEALRAVAVDAVAGTLEPADVAPLYAWYDGALGRRIPAIEQDSARQTPDPQERLRLGQQALAEASQARKASLQAIVTETHSDDMMADTLIEMALAVQEGKAGLAPNTSTESLAELRANLASRRPQLIAHYAQLSLPAYAFTYQTLSEDDLKRYADYLATPAAKALSDGTVRGVARALAAGSVKLGKCLKDAEPASAASAATAASAP